MFRIEGRGPPPITSLRVTPSKVYSADVITKKFYTEINKLGSASDRTHLKKQFILLIHQVTLMPSPSSNDIEISPELNALFTGTPSQIEGEITYFKEALFLVCSHRHYFGLEYKLDIRNPEDLFIHDTLRESNQPDAGYTNTVISILRTIASEKNTLFQPNDTTKFADLQNSLFIFFQSHNENLRLASMGALAADATGLNRLKVEVNHLKDYKDKFCHMIKFIQNRLNERRTPIINTFSSHSNIQGLITELREDVYFTENFRSYFGAVLFEQPVNVDNVRQQSPLEQLITILDGKGSTQVDGTLLYDFEETKFTQHGLLLIETLGKVYLENAQTLESDVVDYFKLSADRIIKIMSQLGQSAKITEISSLLLTGEGTVGLASAYILETIWPGAVSPKFASFLPPVMALTSVVGVYGHIKIVSSADKLLNELSRSIIALVELIDRGDAITYLILKNLSALKATLDWAGINLSVHTGKINVSFKGLVVLNRVYTKIAQKSLSSTVEWILNYDNLRSSVNVNCGADDYTNLTHEQFVNSVRVALRSDATAPHIRDAVSRFDKLILEPYVDPVLTKANDAFAFTKQNIYSFCSIVVEPHRAWQNVVEEAFGLSDISF